MKAKAQNDFVRDWVGGVDVLTGDTSAKLTSVSTDKNGKVKEFPNGTTEMKVKLADLPKAAQRVIKANMKPAKRFRVRLSPEGDEVKTVTPWSGILRARMVGLGPKTETGDYRLIEKVYNEGTEKENRHLEFIAIYEAVSGVFKGVELPGFYLHYKFEAIPEGEEDEGFTQFNTADTPQASQLHKLQGWADVHGGILDEPVVWVDVEDGTILGTLEERALENDREVNLVFDKGYIQSVQPVEDYEEEELPDFLKEPSDAEESIEKVLPKKAAPKSKAKKTVAVANLGDDDL